MANPNDKKHGDEKAGQQQGGQPGRDRPGQQNQQDGKRDQQGGPADTGQQRRDEANKGDDAKKNPTRDR